MLRTRGALFVQGGEGRADRTADQTDQVHRVLDDGDVEGGRLVGADLFDLGELVPEWCCDHGALLQRPPEFERQRRGEVGDPGGESRRPGDGEGERPTLGRTAGTGDVGRGGVGEPDVRGNVVVGVLDGDDVFAVMSHAEKNAVVETRSAFGDGDADVDRALCGAIVLLKSLVGGEGVGRFVDEDTGGAQALRLLGEGDRGPDVAADADGDRDAATDLLDRGGGDRAHFVGSQTVEFAGVAGGDDDGDTAAGDGVDVAAQTGEVEIVRAGRNGLTMVTVTPRKAAARSASGPVD